MILGRLNKGVEHFLVGVLLLFFLMLLGVVGCIRGNAVCEAAEGRGGGGGGNNVDSKLSGGSDGGGGGKDIRDGEELKEHKEDEGGRENFNRFSSSVLRNCFSSRVSAISFSIIFLLVSWMTLI